MENMDDIFKNFINDKNDGVADDVLETALEEKQPQQDQKQVYEKVDKPNKEVKETKQQAQPQQETKAVKVMDEATAVNQRLMARINDIVINTGELFTQKNKTLATDIIAMTYKAVKSSGHSWNAIDVISNNYPNQIKRWAKLGIGANDNLYIDLRRNSKTGMVDIQVKAQYQTIEKLMVMYCSKNIFRFKTDIICVGDNFVTEFDFATGQDTVVKHEKNQEIDRNDLENILGAYKIAYIEEKNGRITQLLCEIDKNRIMRAYNSAQTKNVWNSDTKKMVLKTVTWEMFNGENIRPFMHYPEDILEDLSIVNESSDIDFSNKDHKHKDVINAQATAKDTIGTGEILDI